MLFEAQSRYSRQLLTGWLTLGLIGVIEAVALMPGERFPAGITAAAMFAGGAFMILVVLGFHMVFNPLCQRRCMRFFSTLMAVIALVLAVANIVSAPGLSGDDRLFTAGGVSAAAGMGWMAHLMWKWNRPPHE